MLAGLLLGSPTAGQGFKLNAPLQPAGDVVRYALGPDGRRAFYLADPTSDNVFELFCARTEPGPAPVRVNPDLVAGGDVQEFRVSPDGARLAYLADQDTDESFELYSTPADGQSPRSRSAASWPRTATCGTTSVHAGFQPRRLRLPTCARWGRSSSTACRATARRRPSS
jgi:hypothetical protein